MIVKTTDENFSRDISSKALINTNRNALDDYKLKRKQTQRLDQLESEVKEMKHTLVNIESLLTELLNR